LLFHRCLGIELTTRVGRILARSIDGNDLGMLLSDYRLVKPEPKILWELLALGRDVIEDCYRWSWR